MTVTPDYQQQQPPPLRYTPIAVGSLLIGGYASHQGCVICKLGCRIEVRVRSSVIGMQRSGLRVHAGGVMKVMAMSLTISKSDRTTVRWSCVACCSYKDECLCSDGVES